MALHQHVFAQPLTGTSGHAVRSGITTQQPEAPLITKYGTGFPSPPTFDDKMEEREYLKGRLAAAFRIFGARGFDEGIAGHITIRDPVEPDTMWINPFGNSFSTLRRSDLVRVDYEGNVLEGGRNRLINRAGIMIHRGLYQARPDVRCAAHSHSIFARAFSTLGLPFPITSQDACAFYNVCISAMHYAFGLHTDSRSQDVATSTFEGIVLEGDEGTHIAQALGQKKAIILQNHGLLAASDTVEATVFWYVSLEKLCHVHLTALAAVGGDLNKIVQVKDEDAAETYKSLGLPLSGWFSAKPMFDEIAQQTQESYLA
ncbi:hypothetical protein LTR10_004471 [Elasticomyces elasticus]|nr:hypothetical protein LTR10_004471 [Elasticomyces elasticus]KAK4976790.1 hypothetical protein LTR42_002835 [Elasticomyces elasticus]